MGDRGSLNERLRKLPAVDRVLSALEDEGPHALASGAARKAVDRARERVRRGEPVPTLDEVVSDARSLLQQHGRTRLVPVVNATGVLIHTNLGRAPLGDGQLEAIARVAGGYSNLEYDLAAGRRGDRYSHARALTTALTGAGSALVVNNNAAAVLLVLSALCEDREVIISRGELIEIGGEFRIPDVLALSRAHLVEVGTTNRTHLADYERAITERTAAILKVHPSNYRVVGFTSEVPARDIAKLARGRGVLFVHDVGSGLAASDVDWTRSEPVVSDSIEEGADLVTFSGDKLLGGPQAGVIAGRADLVARIERHPLVRALRVDKMTLAALEETMLAHLEGRRGDLPLWRMAVAPAQEIASRAEALADRLRRDLPEGDVKIEAVPAGAVTGGGSLPGAELPSWAVALRAAERSAAELERALRDSDPPVIARIEDDRVLLDLRAVAPEHDELLASLVLSVFGK